MKPVDLLNLTRGDGIVQQCKPLKESKLTDQVAISDQYPWADSYRILYPREKKLGRKGRSSGTGLLSNYEGPGQSHIRCHRALRPMGFRARRSETDSNPRGYLTPARKEVSRILEALCALLDYQNLAFPYQIDCGSTGGYWFPYEQFIHNFSDRY